jgi:hypothetical protein
MHWQQHPLHTNSKGNMLTCIANGAMPAALQIWQS